MECIGELLFPFRISCRHHQCIGIVLSEDFLDLCRILPQLRVFSEDIGRSVIVRVAVGRQISRYDKYNKDRHHRDHDLSHATAEPMEIRQKSSMVCFMHPPVHRQD